MSVLPQTLGALEVSILMSSILYGLTMLKAWLYAEWNSADTIYLCVLAGLLWLFETLHTTFSEVFLYYITITNYGILASIDAPQWGVVASVPFTFLIMATVQLFFANRQSCILLLVLPSLYTSSGLKPSRVSSKILLAPPCVLLCLWPSILSIQYRCAFISHAAGLV